jgi:Glycosyltransferase family 87/WD40-like Beta Propeller Repeat
MASSNRTEPIPLENSAPSEVDRIPEPRQWLRIGEWMLFALLATYFGVCTLPQAWRTLNTDFPNYYLTARLVREHYDTSRIYEWIWIQRQKDHRNIDQRIVGMVPITPFSTLIVYPLTSKPALTAKHYWTILNLGLLLATVFLLRVLTQLSWRRIALIVALSFSLHINFLYGQYYVLLLFLLTLSCWLYVRQRRFLSGVVVGLAAGLKIFPILYLIYFLRKRDLRAFAGGLAGTFSTAVVSIFVFGWELHRTYLVQVLPSVLRGEGLDPYNLSAASLSSLLHRLFIYEPQLNQHPAINAPWLFAMFHPLLQMAILAPALLLAVPRETGPRRVRLEWAAILVASIATSTSPGTYLFMLLILFACLVLESLQQEKPYFSFAILLPLYVAAGLLGGTNTGGEGWISLLAVPRLYALILLCVFTYTLLIRQQSREDLKLDRPVWTVALMAMLAFSIASNLRHQQGLFADYQWRISAPKDIYMAVDPAIQQDRVLFIAMLGDGYHFAVNHLGTVQFSTTSPDDYLALTANNGERWVEHTGHESTIVSTLQGRSNIRQAESPVASVDGRWLAFLREEGGRTRLWVHALDQPNKADMPLTPPQLNVLEMSFLPNGDLVFAASAGGRPGLFTVDQAGSVQSLGVGEARYPSVSPDGHWLAYSELQGGNWNLWLRNLDSGQAHRFSHAPCNYIDPTWAADSQTLVYASDCGRALWFTALCRRGIFR